MSQLIRMRIAELSADLLIARENNNQEAVQEIATKLCKLRSKLHTINVRNWYSSRKLR